MTLEQRILEELDEEEGIESFNLLLLHGRGAQPALQRLRRKGLAEAARCPDGAWVWFRTRPSSSPANEPKTDVAQSVSYPRNVPKEAGT